MEVDRIMGKKRLVLLLVLVLVFCSSISVFAGTASTGTVYPGVTGSVTADFSSKYGVFAGTISAKPGGTVKLVGYKNDFNNPVKDGVFTAAKRSIGFKKSVGKKCKKIKVAICLNGVRKVDATMTRK